MECAPGWEQRRVDGDGGGLDNSGSVGYFTLSRTAAVDVEENGVPSETVGRCTSFYDVWPRKPWGVVRHSMMYGQHLVVFLRSSARTDNHWSGQLSRMHTYQCVVRARNFYAWHNVDGASLVAAIYVPTTAPRGGGSYG